jgi:hypothetical protein
MSIVTNSDLYMEYLLSLDEAIAQDILRPLRQQLHGVAEVALRKLGVAVENSQDPKFILEAADKALHRLGYAPNKGPEAPRGPTYVQQNNYYTDRATLSEARRRMQERAGGDPERAIEGECAALPGP